MATNGNKKPHFEIATDTRLLYQELTKVKVGEEITYTALAKEMGREIKGSDPYLQSAIRRAFHLDGAVFDNIRGVGYRRLNDQEIVAASAGDTDALRRKARRSAKRLTAIEDFTALPPEARIEHNARLSIFGAIVSMTKQAAIEGVRTQVSSAGHELPFAKTLEAFRTKVP